MRKCFIFLCAMSLACTLLTGCNSKEGEKDTEIGAISDRNTESDAASETDEGKEDVPEVFGEPWTVYVTEKNLYPMSESKTIDGITQQVLTCEVTTSFGERRLENLSELVKDREIIEDEEELKDIWNPNVLYQTDGQGNLTGSGCYVFCTIQFTNTTDTEVEILRNNGRIYFLDENLFVQEESGYEVIYMDELWQEGTAYEIYHYKLGPGESVTSEVGWVIPKSAVDKYDHMYYKMKMNDCSNDKGAGTDPDAVLIELEY